MKMSEREEKGRQNKKRIVREGTEAKTPSLIVFAIRTAANSSAQKLSV
jgi:hypothetical protein